MTTAYSNFLLNYVSLLAPTAVGRVSAAGSAATRLLFPLSPRGLHAGGRGGAETHDAMLTHATCGIKPIIDGTTKCKAQKGGLTL